MQSEERRTTHTYSFPAGLHTRIEEMATAHMGGNRSMMAEKLILDGMEYRRQQPPPKPDGPESRPAGERPPVQGG